MNKIMTYFNKENTTFVAILVVCVCLLAIFVAIATSSGAWPGTDASSQILSALAGAVVAAIITLFLLMGQTASEEKKERNSKIFEEKLRIYQEFLQKLCDVVKDQKITPEEEIELQFQVSYIAMHTSSNSINNISEQVKDIVEKIKRGESGCNEMLEQLFNIADTFHKELYVVKDDKKEDPARSNTIDNFHSILVPKNDIDKYDLALQLKAKIHPNGSKQWIWNKSTLVHEYFTDISEKGSYIKGKNTIAIDLLIEEEYTIRVGTRKNDPKETEKVAIGIDGEFKPGNTTLTGPHWHIHKQLPKSTSIDEIAHIMENLLEKVKNYRNRTFPLK